VDYDLLLEDIGQLGPWQWKLLVLLCFPSAMSAMAVFMYDFTAFVPKHRCFVPLYDNVTSAYEESYVNFTIPWDEKLEGYSQCEMYSAVVIGSKECERESFPTNPKVQSSCQDWVFDHTLIKSSAVEDFEMVCEGNTWKKGFTQTFYMIGMLVGSFGFGWLSDFGGRKSTLMLGLVILAIGGSIPYLINPNPANYYVLVISRFISGLGHVGTFMMSFSLALEYVGPEYRTLFGILIETPFAIGGLIVGLVSWAGFRDWQFLSLVLSVPNIILLLPCWWLLPESPRWLIAKNKMEHLMKVLQNAADTNKTVLPDLIESSPSQKSPAPKASLRDLFSPTTILVRSSVMFVNWFVVTMCYYGLTSAAATLTTNLYTNFSLAIAVEIPAYFACMKALDIFGRKPVLVISQIIAGVTCIAAGFFTADSVSWLQITLVIIGKLGATAGFAVVFVYTAEMYPTEIRSTAVGISSLCGRIGGIIAPQIESLSSVNTPLPLVIMGSCSLFGGILVYMFLPETLGKKLPETMHDALQLGK